MVVSKSIVHQTLACFPVIFNQFMIGVGAGWIAPTLSILRDPTSAFQATAEQISWLGAINDVGKILGLLFATLLIDNAGRKCTLFLLTIVYFMVWLSTNFARSIYPLCVARISFGVANGVNDVVSGIYTAENCSPNFRGIIGSIVLLTFYGAMFLEYTIATYLSYDNTAIVNTIMAGCVFAALYFGTETPYFLILKGKREKAEKNLIWLSGDMQRDEVADELKRIERNIAEEKLKRQSLKLLFSSPANIKGMLVVVGMDMLGMTTGGNAMTVYSPLIFASSATFSANTYTVLFGAVQLMAVAVSPFIIENVNRRSLVIFGQIGCTSSNICSYLLLYLHNKGYEVAFYPWLIFLSISSFSMFSALVSPAGFALKGELLPFSVRAIGTSMAVAGFSISSFTTAKAFLPISENFGMETNFLIYSAMGILNIVFLYCILPETRGKTLHELQHSRKGEHVILGEISNESPEKDPPTLV